MAAAFFPLIPRRISFLVAPFGAPIRLRITALMFEPMDHSASARAAGLRYVSDAEPGIARRRAGRGFAYAGPDGAPIRDRATLARIRSLVLPPAWTDVWICPHSSGHIQASARDARGRKQYRYHDRWREVRDSTKFERLIPFGEALPALRARISRDLSRPGLCRERVLATVVRLLERTRIRVGNEEYARQNDSYGLTTLLNEHVEVDGSALLFRFRAKSGKECAIDVRDPRAARIVGRCQELPGQRLFEYLDADGTPHGVTSTDVNDYLREAAGEDFTAKDFRTWAGTVLAYTALRAGPECDSESEARRAVADAVRSVAAALNNTPAVCRKSYVHPAVIEAYMRAGGPGGLDSSRRPAASANHGLEPEERALLAFLKGTCRNGGQTA